MKAVWRWVGIGLLSFFVFIYLLNQFVFNPFHWFNLYNLANPVFLGALVGLACFAKKRLLLGTLSFLTGIFILFLLSMASLIAIRFWS